MALDSTSTVMYTKTTKTRLRLSNRVKRKVFDSRVLPVLTYGAETLMLTKTSINKVRVAQRAMMELSMLGISLRDRKSTSGFDNKLQMLM